MLMLSAHAAAPPMKALKQTEIEWLSRVKKVAVLCSQTVGETELLCWAIGSPFFEVRWPLQNMHSMLPHKYNIVHPPRMLLCDLYGAGNDGMIRAGKLRKEKTVGSFSSGPGLALGAIA
jgi:hypothetical protein